MKTDNDDRLRQELRLAQLEIKVLREQLLKSAQEAQRTREQMEELSRRLIVEEPPKPVPPVAKQNGAPPNELSSNGNPRVLCVEDSEPNFRLIESVLRERPGIELVWAETGAKALQSDQYVIRKLQNVHTPGDSGADIHTARKDFLQHRHDAPRLSGVPIRNWRTG